MLRRRRRNEDGAVAILVAVLSLVLLMLAALALDIGLQINQKHQLWTTLDSAAQAGASKLPGSTVDAKTTALAYAKSHDPTETGTAAPNVDFWCIVGATGSAPNYAVDTSQIPSTCYPGPAPYTVGLAYNKNGDTSNRKIACSSKLCAIPCATPTNNTGTPKVACNTIRVYQGKTVPFGFARAGGIDEGSTGNLISVACKGSCGTVAPNPLDVAIIADRTLSMQSDDVDEMIAGIKGMLQQMTQSQQYVAMGAIGRSQPGSASQSGTCNSTSKGLTWPSSSGSSGRWVPISFSNNYAPTKGTLDNNSTLVKAVNCLTNQSSAGQGTNLAAPMKAAARYLLNLDPNNLSSLPSRPTAATKVLILETDGQPNESEDTGGSTGLGSSEDVFSNKYDVTTVTTTQSDQVSTSGGVTTTTHRKTITHTYVGGQRACDNLEAVAANAKAQNILVITIAYNMDGKRCGDYDGGSIGDDGDTNGPNGVVTNGPESNTSTRKYQTRTITTYVDNYAATEAVLNVLASAASPKPGGGASVADSTCTTTTQRTAENSDGDYFFCAASGDNMAPIFATALGQASKGIKLIKLP